MCKGVSVMFSVYRTGYLVEGIWSDIVRLFSFRLSSSIFLEHHILIYIFPMW